MSERLNILARIREALRTPSARPGHHGHEHSPAVEAPSQTARAEFGQWLPAVGPTEEEQFALFARQAADLRADFHRPAGRDEAVAKLREIAHAEGWQRVATHGGELTNGICLDLSLPVLNVNGGYQATDLEKVSAGISECDVLIAQTGSVFISSASAGGRALSVLPPHHVVLARRDQLVPDLPAAFAHVRQKYAPNFPSFLSVVTGPSRTGDIERILVLGAHGPKKLTILCY